MSRSWARERERIFGRTWCAVGREADVDGPGDYLRVEVAGESVLVTRDADGALHAFFNVCRHRGAELVDPSGDACGGVRRAIRCPYHSWTYALDGRLRRAPFLGPVTDADAAAFALAPRSRSTPGAGSSSCNLDPASAAALLDQLGEIPGRVVRYPLRRRPRAVRASSTRSRRTGRCSRRTTTSATTAVPSTRSCATSCRRSGAPAATGSTGSAASPTARVRTRSRPPARRPARRSPASTRTSWCGTRASSPSRTCCSASRATTSRRSS